MTKKQSKKIDTAAKRTKKPVQKNKQQAIARSSAAPRQLRRRVQQLRQSLKERRSSFLERRPHRSFHRTRRRDYVRSLKIPGYWSLTVQAVKMIAVHKWTFFGLALLYALIVFILSGLMDQDLYKQIKATAESTAEEGFVSGTFATMSLFGGVVYSHWATQPRDGVQQIVGLFALVMVWLTTVWLVRAFAAGKTPRIRDGMYQAGAPIVAFIVLCFIALCQLLPAALGVVLYTALQSADILSNTPMLIIAAAISGLLGVLSLYWLTSTVFAMIIVTLPGIYPMQAIRMAGDIVIGRRIRVLLRLSWLVLMMALFWAVLLIPIIMFDGWLSSVVDSAADIPLIPVSVLLIASCSAVFAAVYIYLFYRKVVKDGSAPA